METKQKCLHFEIARHPYAKEGWDLRIGNIVGSIGISIPNNKEGKKAILEEISRQMDELGGR